MKAKLEPVLVSHKDQAKNIVGEVGLRNAYETLSGITESM